MKTSKLFVASLMSFLLLSGCNLSGNSGDRDQSSDIKNNFAAPEHNSGKDNLKLASTDSETKTRSIENRIVIMKGIIKIETGDFTDSENKLIEIVKKYSGYITNSSSEMNAAGNKSGSITVRIPFDKFHDFQKEISALGKVLSQDINGKDVTEEYIDLEARIRTQRELENRLLTLLSQKTGKLIEIIEVEQKLSSVRENIESAEGRIKYLKDQSTYSTIEVMFFEPSMLHTASGGGFFYEIEQGFKKGLKGFTEILSGLIMITVSLSHIIIFLIILFIIARKYFRKRSLSNSQLAG